MDVSRPPALQPLLGSLAALAPLHARTSRSSEKCPQRSSAVPVSAFPDSARLRFPRLCPSPPQVRFLQRLPAPPDGEAPLPQSLQRRVPANAAARLVLGRLGLQ